MIPDLFVREQVGADALVEGCYLIQRTRARRVDIPVRIWFGPPLDEDGEELDRSWRWQVAVAGMLLDEEPFSVGGILFEHLSGFWPACAGWPISREEYDYRIARTEWAAVHDPDDAFSTPGGRISSMTARLPFSD